MAQVFISYKSEERERLRLLVRALESAGIEVWWDTQIAGGAAWREAIQRELESARCVMVVWSNGSVGPGGRFVRDEATWALERGTYLPVMIDEVRLPLGFGEVQAISLTGWNGDPGDDRFRAIISAVRASGTEANLRDSTFAAAPLPASRPRRLSRRAFIAGGALASTAVAVLLFKFRPHPSAGMAEGIAVLPFANLSDDPSQVYFSAGLAEELRAALNRIARLKIIGRASCEKVKDLPANDVAAKLGVAHVLTGSVRRTATQLRVSTQLVDGSTGVELWSQTYDRAPGNELEIQTEIAESIAGALRIRLAPTEKAALLSGGTGNSQAYDLVLRANARIDVEDGEPVLRQVIAMMEAAIALDPQYHEAHLLRARALAGLSGIAHSPQQGRELLAEAKIEAHRAITLAPALARGYVGLGYILAADLDLPGALAQHRRGFALASDDGFVLRVYAAFLAGIAHVDEAIKLSARAVALDPLDPLSYGQQSTVLFFARRYPESADAAKHALAIAPLLTQTRTTLGDCRSLMGQYDEARAEYAQVDGDDSFKLTGEAILAIRTHDRALALSKLARLKEVFGDAASVQQAEVNAQLGDRSAAYAALERGLETKDGGMQQIAADPWLDPLRPEPQFQALLRRLAVPA